CLRKLWCVYVVVTTVIRARYAPITHKNPRIPKDNKNREDCCDTRCDNVRFHSYDSSYITSLRRPSAFKITNSSIITNHPKQSCPLHWNGQGAFCRRVRSYFASSLGFSVVVVLVVVVVFTLPLWCFFVAAAAPFLSAPHEPLPHLLSAPL